MENNIIYNSHLCVCVCVVVDNRMMMFSGHKTVFNDAFRQCTTGERTHTYNAKSPSAQTHTQTCKECILKALKYQSKQIIFQRGREWTPHFKLSKESEYLYWMREFYSH